MRRLLLWHLPVLVIWYLLRYHHTSSSGDWVDRLIAAELAVSFGFAAVVMLRSNDEWRPRAVGLLFTSVALSVLFAGVFWLYVHVLPSYVPTVLAHPPLPTVDERIVDITRAYFLVGGPLLAFGLAHYTADSSEIIQRIRGRDEMAAQADRLATATERIADAAEGKPS